MALVYLKNLYRSDMDYSNGKKGCYYTEYNDENRTRIRHD